MTVSERIPFSGLLLPLQEGYTYSCDRRTTTDRFFLFRMTKPGVTLTGEMSLWRTKPKSAPVCRCFLTSWMKSEY